MITKKSLFSWTLSRYLGLQFLLFVIIVVMVLARVFPLEMQKRIVNIAISQRDLNALYLYCVLYLTAVVTAGVLKYVTNLLQDYIGQKLLVEIRTKLYDHIIRLPLPFFRRTPGGMVISSLTSELSTVGDFLGSALATPLINILTLLTFGGYMFYLNPLLALLSLAIYPFEVAIIPYLQNRYNELNRDRIDVTRSVSNTIGEVVSGIHEVHGNGSYVIENQRFGRFIDTLFGLRYRMSVVKYGIKFVNNFFQSLGPFILFLVGGYLSIHGYFNLGALVAFLSAYEKLYDPWRELMDYYQSLQDSRVRYYRVMEYFDSKPEFEVQPLDRDPFTLTGHIEVQNLSYIVSQNTRLLDQVSFSIQPGQQLALVGFSGSGKSTLAMILGQIYNYTGGQVLFDGKELRSLTKRDTIQNIGFLAQHPFIFDGSIQDNLLYACESILVNDRYYKMEGQKQDGQDGKEKGSEKPEEYEKYMPDQQTILRMISNVGLHDDILRLGLYSVLLPDQHRDLIPQIIHMRELFYMQWGDDLADWVEFFNIHRYMYYSEVSDNITFGNPNREEYKLENLPENSLFQTFLEENGLTTPLLDLGRHLARHTVTLLSDLRGEAFFFEQSPIPEKEFELYEEVVDRLEKAPQEELSTPHRNALLRLALRYIPTKHKMAALPVSLENQIIKVRSRFMRKMTEEDPEGFIFYRSSDYLYHQAILDNILFGHLKQDRPHAMEKVQERIFKLLQQENLMDEIMRIGLEFRVGSGGDRLSGGQKQKVALARVLLKNPPILILDEATASLDNASQTRIQNLLDTEYRGKCTIISVVHRLDTVKEYDRIAVMKAGKIIEMGAYEELMTQEGSFYELVNG